MSKNYCSGSLFLSPVKQGLQTSFHSVLMAVYQQQSLPLQIDDLFPFPGTSGITIADHKVDRYIQLFGQAGSIPYVISGKQYQIGLFPADGCCYLLHLPMGVSGDGYPQLASPLLQLPTASAAAAQKLF